MRFPLAIFKISGHSMQPKFNPGDKILVFTWAYKLSQPKVRDVVVFKKGGEVWVKRVSKVRSSEVGVGSIVVAGDNKRDSAGAGEVAAKDVLGRVIWNFPT